MKAFWDGDMICLVDDDFIDLQESDAIFFHPTDTPQNILEQLDNLMVNP